MNDEPSSETPTGNNKNLIIAGIVVLLVLLGGFIVFGRDTAQREETSTDIDTEESLEALEAESDLIQDDGEAPAAVQGEVKEFTVDGSNFTFSLKEIQVNEGDTVRITLTNGSTMPHDWRLDEFSAATNVIQPGQEDTIEFVADQAGTFEYYCSVGQHRQLGMVGKLIVE